MDHELEAEARCAWGVDVAGLDETDEPIVLVEAELRRHNPVSNVVTIWMWAENGRIQRPCYFIQAFSKIFKESKIEHKERAEFIARHMEAKIGSKISYHSILFEYRPTKHGKIGGGRRRHHARELAALILSATAKLDPHTTSQA